MQALAAFDTPMTRGEVAEMELTVLMPCLNEAETVATCVRKATDFLSRAGVKGEVVVADNGSTDGSQALAAQAGARVVPVERRGYGAALQGGIAAAKGRFVIMGDADDSYDFEALEGLLAALRTGHDLVMGNRFAGGIQPGAMPWLHRHLGNPVLSFLGRLFFRTPIGDFHCGLRGFSREAVEGLRLSTEGMEFASEMVVKSALHRLSIAEVPVTLAPDGRSRAPHLRTWRDGWRHLKFLLLHSPRWLFLLPGTTLLALGTIAMIALFLQPIELGRLGLDIHTMAYASAAVLLGFQMVLFSLLTKGIGISGGWLPPHGGYSRVLRHLTLERCLLTGATALAAGLAISVAAVMQWAHVEFGELDPRQTMRLVMVAVTLLALAGEMLLAGFSLEAIRQGIASQARRN